MALNALKCNCLTPLHFKGLKMKFTLLSTAHTPTSGREQLQPHTKQSAPMWNCRHRLQKWPSDAGNKIDRSVSSTSSDGRTVLTTSCDGPRNPNTVIRRSPEFRVVGLRLSGASVVPSSIFSASLIQFMSATDRQKKNRIAVAKCVVIYLLLQ